MSLSDASGVADERDAALFRFLYFSTRSIAFDGPRSFTLRGFGRKIIL
jgi:hypothetical protein